MKEVSDEDLPEPPPRSRFYDPKANPIWQVGDVLQVRCDPARSPREPQQVEVIAKTEAKRGKFRGVGKDKMPGEADTVIYTVRDLKTGREYQTFADTLERRPS
jgi:hypothetical protein